MQSTLNEPNAAAWEQIAPLLDDAMGRLGETDRDAIVLRFFENKTAREVGAALKLTEAAAHKRVNRALEKLRKIFSKRGVTLSGTIIAVLHDRYAIARLATRILALQDGRQVPYSIWAVEVIEGVFTQVHHLLKLRHDF